MLKRIDLLRILRYINFNLKIQFIPMFQKTSTFKSVNHKILQFLKAV